MGTAEGNKIIARFMGKDVMVTYSDASGKNWNSMVGIGSMDKYDKVFLQYHESWDWLMPVVDKIQKMNLREDFSLFDFDQYCGVDRYFLFDLKIYSQLETVWLSVIQFIQWYNTQTK